MWVRVPFSVQKPLLQGGFFCPPENAPHWVQYQAELSGFILFIVLTKKLNKIYESALFFVIFQKKLNGG
ncbi:MAG TPA: hypothetical protein DHV98_05975 [Flavobacteriaceae bacterium]|nr:hypothetical protein [Flavobacteriaceae bacterium]